MQPDFGLLVIDDSTLDKPHARQAVVQGINLVSLVWTEGDCCLPVDYRIYHKDSDGLSKNDHFQRMLRQAQARGFTPALVACDGWYSSLENLKLVRDNGWFRLTRFKHNRQVSLQPGQALAIDALAIPASGLVVHLRGYGFIRVFRLVDPHGHAQHWATSQLELTEDTRRSQAERAWCIEEYHRSLKQFTGIERAQFRRGRLQRNPVGLALRAFVRLELHRLHQWISHAEPKAPIIRHPLRLYLAHPTIRLPSTAYLHL